MKFLYLSTIITLAIYRYKEFKLQISLLGPKTLVISLLNQLLPKQG